MKYCIYCKRQLDEQEPWQKRNIYISALLTSVDFFLHDRCYQARLRWKQEDQL